MHTDPRAFELQELAASEGIRLPMPIPMILWLEDHGCVVDLITGKAIRPSVSTPTPSGRAIAHLTQNHVGAL